MGPISLGTPILKSTLPPVSRSPSKPTGCCSATDARSPYHGGLLQERLVALAGHALQGWAVKDVDDASGVVDSPGTLDFACNFRDRCPAHAKHFRKKFLR